MTASGEPALLPSDERIPWAQRLGGRWAISMRGWLISLPFALVGTALAQSGEVTGPLGVALWLGPGLLGWLSLGLVLGLAHLSILRHRAQRPVPVAVVLAVGALGGASRSLTVGLAATASGLAEVTEWGLRAVGGAILGAVWLPLMAATLDGHDRYRRARDELIASRLAEQIQALGTAENTEALRQQLLAGVDEDLTKATADLRVRIERLRNADPMTADELTPLAEDLSQAATDAVRPLSQRLWTAQQASIPRLRLLEILQTTITTSSLQPTPAIIIGVIAGITGISVNEPLIVALQSILPAAAVMWTWLVVMERLRHRATRAAATYYIVGLIGAALLSLTLIPSLQAAGVNPASSYGWAAMGLLIFVPTIVLLGASQVVAQERRHVLQQLQEQLHGTRLQRIAAEEQATSVRREVSEFLHGTVQSQLMAASLAVANAQRTGDRALLERGLDSAAAALDLRRAGTTSTSDNVLDGIRTVTDSWQGLVEIDLRLPDASMVSDVPATLGRLTTSVVREAVANAVRHGQARHVVIGLRAEPDALVVTVENDGTTPTSPRPGLGSTLLDRIDPGGWRLEPREGGGARLTVRLARPSQ